MQKIMPNFIDYGMIEHESTQQSMGSASDRPFPAGSLEYMVVQYTTSSIYQNLIQIQIQIQSCQYFNGDSTRKQNINYYYPFAQETKSMQALSSGSCMCHP